MNMADNVHFLEIVDKLTRIIIPGHGVDNDQIIIKSMHYYVDWNFLAHLLEMWYRGNMHHQYGHKQFVL